MPELKVTNTLVEPYPARTSFVFTGRNISAKNKFAPKPALL